MPTNDNQLPPTPGPRSQSPTRDFKFVEKLKSGSTFEVNHVIDLLYGKKACLKIVQKQQAEDVNKKRQNAVQAELEAYQIIAKSQERCDFIMEYLDYFEKSDSWQFLMVSGRVLPSIVTD